MDNFVEKLWMNLFITSFPQNPVDLWIAINNFPTPFINSEIDGHIKDFRIFEQIHSPYY